MNIRELIETLSQFDPETRVVVAGYEGGFNDITQIQPCEIRLNMYQDWFYGSHGKADDAQIQQLLPDAPIAAAVVLKGENQNSEGLTSTDLMGAWGRRTMDQEA
ncbi:hypothetical protein K9N68_20965 [Kovacikia minuta CCNUW1]|uniref:hypothetical protein n=1 Tax=Kovacikia minuta TaxID=2931930 RepID=UPI001CCC89F0|nr:hypothetical protein [Kovacikia minuta]UBF24179.1 hypothetical protein K9N68_20965 [Kovacikia minuta CCNUW1]